MLLVFRVYLRPELPPSGFVGKAEPSRSKTREAPWCSGRSFWSGLNSLGGRAASSIGPMAEQRPLILLAPGAGAPSSSPWMQALAQRLAAAFDVVPFDYPYMRAGRKRPDPLPTLIAAHREALGSARRGRTGPVFLVGKSMGGRVGCHVALEAEVTGLVCLGYPLKGAGPKASLRDEVLIRLRTPILFIQGTRDPLCPLPL